MKDLLLKGLFGNDISLTSVTKTIEGSDYSKGINVIIDSEGGSLVQAILITDYLLSLNYPLLVTGIKVASAATWVFLGIKDRTISPEAGDNWLFIHKAALSPAELGEETLSAEVLRDIATKIDQFNLLLVKLYADSFSISIEEADRLMSKETWLTQKQAEEYQIVALLNPTVMNRIEELLAAIQGKRAKAIVAEVVSEPTAVVEVESETEVQPVEGMTLESLAARISALEVMCSGMEASMKAKDAEIVAKDQELEKVAASYKAAADSVKSKDALLDTITAQLTSINEAELNVTNSPRTIVNKQSSVLQRAAQVIHNQNK